MLEWIPGVGSVVARATWVDWTVLVGGLGALLYWLSTWTHDHFRRRGMPYARPLPLVGSMGPVALGRKSLFDLMLHIYNEFEDQPAFGFFQFMRPGLFIKDPELIKLVAVKYFEHFTDHQEIVSEKVEPLFGRSLLALKGQEWQDMRATLSPAFTSSKMRFIFKLIDSCGAQMATFLEKKIETSGATPYEMDMKDFFTRFASDVIATSAFGIECDSMRQPDNEFYRMGRTLTNTKGVRTLIFLGYMFLPKLMETLRIPFNSPQIRTFYHSLIHDTIKERQQKGIFRPDMLQLLMQAREGQLKAEAGDEQENISGAKLRKLTDQDMTSQAVIFFFAGFETVSTAMSYCAYALARHPEVQQRLQREVDETFEKNGGKLTYEAVQEAKYLDMFISEVMRLYSAVPSLDRKCTKDFTIPAHGNVPAYTVRKGDSIWIPVIALHKDPKYWDDPETFNPERFSEENKPKIKPFTYMPFGVGPRICIGFRFALLEAKVALAHILRHLTFRETAKTPKEVVYSPTDLSGVIKGGFWVGLAPRAPRQ
ncbi:hypothetical protein R5R35_010766 [Gryllus longicercus]|uniref:Cytochrome P450 n=1 Tax=Gryllus longicercus TaxID=2509291 RepID=A0AAN9VFV6_9ORTH